MERRALVDSSFYIRRLRARLDPLLELAAASDDWEFLTCGVVQVEVLRGMTLPKPLERMTAFLGCMILVPSSNRVWERAHKLAWQLDRKGIVMQVTDLIIATCALESDAAVLTLDSDFLQVPGLRVISALG